MWGIRVLLVDWEDVQTVSSRGSKSRNKVSVGEPAEGSLPFVMGKKKSLAGLFLIDTPRSPGVGVVPPGPKTGMCLLYFCRRRHV